MSGTRAISTTSRRELSSSFSPLQDKAPKEIHAILTETLACFFPGRAKDLSAPHYIGVNAIFFFNPNIWASRRLPLYVETVPVMVIPLLPEIKQHKHHQTHVKQSLYTQWTCVLFVMWWEEDIPENDFRTLTAVGTG